MVPIFDERFSRPMQPIAFQMGPAKRKYNTTRRSISDFQPKAEPTEGRRYLTVNDEA
jgi:hypothetical protein